MAVHDVAFRHFAGTTNDGQEPAPEAVGLTRSLVVAAALGLLNAILILLPISDADAAGLAAALNPVVTVAAFVLYGRWDRALKKAGKK